MEIFGAFFQVQHYYGFYGQPHNLSILTSKGSPTNRIRLLSKDLRFSTTFHDKFSDILCTNYEWPYFH